MNKFLTKIATAFVGIAMAIGVGVGLNAGGAREAKAATATFDLSATGYKGTDLPGGVTEGPITLKATKNSSTAWRSNTENLRVYQNAELTITGDNTVASIDSVTVTPGGSYNPNGNYTFVAQPSGNSITYSAGGMAMPSGTTSFVITRSTSGRCDLSSISVSYTASGGGAANYTTTISVTGGALSTTEGHESTSFSSETTSGNIYLTPSIGYKVPTSNLQNAFTVTGTATKGTITTSGLDVVIPLTDVGSDITIGGSFEAKTSRTLTYVVGDHGQHDGNTEKSFTVYQGDEYNVLSPADVGISADGNYIFTGWTDGTDNYAVDSTYSIGGQNITLTALWEAEPNYDWISVELASLTIDDVFVIVGNNGSNYAMSNNNGASSAPNATAVTIANDKITSSVTNNIKWTLTKDSTNYTFYPNGSSTEWLYCINNNNGLRVGTGADKTFSIDGESEYLFNNGQERYIGIYNSSDWRSYTSVNNNIKDQTFSFFKRVVGLPTITGLTANISSVQKQFDVGDTFNYTNLTVTATVDDNNVNLESTEYSVSTPDLTVAGTKTVTITYTGSSYQHNDPVTTSYQITVVPSAADTIAAINNIGEVVYTTASYNKIVNARDLYDALPIESQANVSNYSTLTTAESDFEDLILGNVSNVENLIDAIGVVSISSGTSIETAETAYSNLLDGDLGKSVVNETKYNALLAARNTYDGLVADKAVADDVAALIEALPAANTITDYSHHADIAAARTAFDALTNSQKQFVSASLVQKLVDCETADAEFAPDVNGTYSKVINLSQLVNGAKVIITNSDGTKAMGSQSSNNRSQTDGASSENGTIIINNNSTSIQVFNVENYSTQEKTIIAFKTINTLNDSGDGYIYAASSGSNHLKTESTVSDNSKFTVTLDNDAFTISAESSSNRHVMQYNSASSLFYCYQNASQSAVAIYVETSSLPTTTFTVTYDANGGTGTMTDSNSPYNSGATVTVLENSFTRDGYTFVTWNTAGDRSGQDYAEGATFDISANTTLYAIWEENSGGGSSSAKRYYRLVTSTDDLVAGAKYLIVATESSYAMSTTQNTNNRGQEEISISDTIVSSTKESVQEVVLGGSTGAWNFGVSGGYLYAASSSANHLKTEASPDANGNANWAISFDGNVATIVAQGNYSRNTMQYNSGSGLFACYSSASQTAVSLYRLDFEATLLGDVTCSGSGTHSMPDGYSWNVDLQGVYNDLPESEKLELAEKSATPGSGLERYDYIVGKYNPTGENDSSKTDYVHFITGRTVTPRSNPRVLVDIALGDKDNTMTIIVVISMTSVLALGAFFFIKKRKEQ